jgi:hypothetical protein
MPFDMGVWAILNDNAFMKEQASSAVATFAGVVHSDRIDEAAEKKAWEIDKALEDSWERASAAGKGVYDPIQSIIMNGLELLLSMISNDQPSSRTSFPRGSTMSARE